MKKISICFIVSLLLLTACGESRLPETISIPEESNTPSSILDLDGETEAHGEQEDYMTVALSTEEKSVVYDGDIHFISDAFAADGQNLYLYQPSGNGEKGLYRMEIGSNAMSKMDIEIPEEMEVYGMLCDMEGKIHVIMKTKPELLNDKNGRCIVIWVLDQNQKITGQLDVTEHVKNDTAPPWFWAIDKDGNYYIRTSGSNADMIILNAKGDILHQIVYDSLEYEGISSLGRGRDGRIYAILYEGTSDVIGVIDANTGRIEEVYKDVLPEDEKWERVMGAGTDTELLIYCREIGLFACNPQTGVWEQRMESEPPEEDKKVTAIRYFLPDGRFLRVEILNDGNGNRKESIFHYIAGGH